MLLEPKFRKPKNLGKGKVRTNIRNQDRRKSATLEILQKALIS